MLASEMKGKSKCSMFCNCKLLFMENSNGGFNFLSANRVNREVGCVRPCDADAPSHSVTLLLPMLF